MKTLNQNQNANNYNNNYNNNTAKGQYEFPRWIPLALVHWVNRSSHDGYPMKCYYKKHKIPIQKVNLKL